MIIVIKNVTNYVKNDQKVICQVFTCPFLVRHIRINDAGYLRVSLKAKID